jgi:hypothetical protein
MKKLWQKVCRSNPILWLEIRRIRRRHWWPGRRFFLFYPVLLGIALGYGVMLLLTRASQGVLAVVLVTGVPISVILGLVVWLLGLGLPWIAPVLSAPAFAREREMSTFDILRTTLLSERALVLGKLGACVAQLWPGILLLILLAPFQLLGVFGGGTLCMCPPYYDVASLLSISDQGAELVIVWGVVRVVLGMLRSLADILLNTSIGLFISTMVRSSGAAVSFTYGVVLVIRVMVWLFSSVLGTALIYSFFSSQILYDFPTSYLADAFDWLLINLPSFLIIGFEIVGSIGLIWGAIWRLGRE